MLGLFEPVCAPWHVDGVPEDFSFGTSAAGLGPDGAVPGEGDGPRSRSSLEAGVRTFFCGPESFTPDLPPIVGEAPELRNYFVAAGLNSIGILTGGGHRPGASPTGSSTAAPTSTSPASTSTGCTPTRRNPEYRRDPHRRVARAWSTSATTRAARCRPPAAPSSRRCTSGWSPQRRLLPDVSGWEGADWYAPAGRRAGRRARCPGAGQTWFGLLGAPSTRPRREGVIVMDMSFMSKFLVQGRDAGRGAGPASRPTAVDGEPGVITYTQWLNERRHARGRPHRHQARRRPLLGGRLRHRPPARR